jgi:Zn-dependent oligopeptidase
MLKENQKNSTNFELYFWDCAYQTIHLVQKSKYSIEKINIKQYLTPHLLLATMTGLFIGFILGIVFG